MHIHVTCHFSNSFFHLGYFRILSRAHLCQVLVVLFFFFLKIFIYFWLFWVFVAAGGFSLVAASRGYCLVVLHGLLITVTSLVAEHGFQGSQTHRLKLQSTGLIIVVALNNLVALRHLLGPESEPMSLALQGGFLTTGPPGKPGYSFYIHQCVHVNPQIPIYPSSPSLLPW